MWEAFLHSLECVVILVILGGAGYWTAQRGWYDAKSPELIAKLVTFLSLPPYLFYSVSNNLTHDQLFSLAGAMVVPFVSMWSCFAISLIIGRVMNVDPRHRGTFASAFTASNNMFIGVPVSLALFGEEAMIPTLLYFFANTTFFWTAGNYLEAADGMINSTIRPKLFSLTTIKRVFSPPLIGFLMAIVLLILNIKLPAPIMQSARYLGGITTPLALIFIGLMIYRIGIRNIRFSRDILLVFLGRFAICPLTVLMLVQIFPVPDMIGKVYVIQAALPCITQIAVLSKFHHADVEFATTAVASTTLLSLVSIPLWMMIITALG